MKTALFQPGSGRCFREEEKIWKPGEVKRGENSALWRKKRTKRRKRKEFEKNCEIVVDISFDRWYIMQAVWHGRRARANDFEKSWKKGLTSEGRPDTIYRLSRADPRREPRTKKKFEKTWKKFLTNAERCGKIATVPPMRRAPCKLNNVTNEKHQTETFLVECRRRGCRLGFSQLPSLVTRVFEAEISFNKMI